MTPTPAFDDDVLLRYSRQIMLPQVGVEGQQRLGEASVLVVGVGGLGSPVAMYLAAAGVGRMELFDDDRVDLSNLQRQVVHGTAEIGATKVASAQRRLGDLNPHVEIVGHAQRLGGERLDAVIGRVDLVVDCSDNFATRFALNRQCRARRTPLVSGAAIRWEGQVAVFDQQPGSPCYRCLYDESGEEDTHCSDTGVIAPLVGVIGAMQALEAIKCLCAVGQPLAGRLLVFDGLRASWRELTLRADPACPVCGS
jgi:adenylyltransferase/sulfurtransferase